MTERDWELLKASNRGNWDERTSIHLSSRIYDVEGWLRHNPRPRCNFPAPDAPYWRCEPKAACDGW